MFKHVYLILIKQPVHITIYICMHTCMHARMQIHTHTDAYMPQATNISEIIHTLVISVKT